MSAASFDLAALLAARAERALARLIAESSTAERLVRELDGARFTVLVEGLSTGIEMTAGDGRVGLRPFFVGAAPGPDRRDLNAAANVEASGSRGRRPLRQAHRQATLSATPIDLLRLACGRGLANLRATRAELSGSLHVAEGFAALLEHARPDWEEELSRWVGDYAAHGLGSVARHAHAWLDRALHALAADTAEYLQEESSALPAAPEARAFYADVERLRDDVERAAERVRRLAAGAPPPPAQRPA